jgi:hypothetical protein
VQRNNSVNNELGVYDAIDSEVFGVYEAVGNEILGIREFVGNGELALIVNNSSISQHNAFNRDNHDAHEPAHYNQPVTGNNNSLTNNQCVTCLRYVLVYFLS